MGACVTSVQNDATYKNETNMDSKPKTIHDTKPNIPSMTKSLKYGEPVIYSKKDLENWTNYDVLNWVKTCKKLNSLTTKERKKIMLSFKKNNIMGSTLPTLTDNDLKNELNIKALGTRRAIIDARNILIINPLKANSNSSIAIDLNEGDITLSKPKILGYDQPSNSKNYLNKWSTQIQKIAQYGNDDYVSSDDEYGDDNYCEVNVDDLKKKIKNEGYGFIKVRNEAYNHNVGEVIQCNIENNWEDCKIIDNNNGSEMTVKLLGSNKYINISTNVCKRDNNPQIYEWAKLLWKSLCYININTISGNELVTHVKTYLLSKYFAKGNINDSDILNILQTFLDNNYIRQICDPKDRQLTFQTDASILYAITPTQRYSFVMDEEPDRRGWTVGTTINIYSSSTDKWLNGKIIYVDNNINTPTNIITVSYKNESIITSKKIYRYDNYSCKSDRNYIKQRNSIKKGDDIKVYSVSQNEWYKGKIEKVLLKTETQQFDIFTIIYTTSNDKKFVKHLDRWSCLIKSL